MRRLSMISACCCLLLVSLTVQANIAADLIEPPALQQRVSEGSLQAIHQRIPEQPYVVEYTPPLEPGQYGGEIRLLMGKHKDIRQLVVYGYARLISYTPEGQLKSDILQSYAVEQGRIFTFRLRKGHKWSDGRPFTSDDFRYYWEDVANNPELSRAGPPPALLIDGEPPVVEYPDAYTVRYSWSKPNPYFVPALAGARPLYIYKPAHYLRQFHRKYQEPAMLDAMIEQHHVRNWMGVHIKHDRPYKYTNPDLPTLQPWVNTTAMPADRFIFKRNPYFYRIDSNGLQLPYIDRVVISIVDGRLVPMKSAAGESDLQARHLRMDNYTFLKQADEQNSFNVRLWKTGKGAHMALYPNFNTRDQVYRELIHQLDFRRALSLAINRREINQVVYFGLARESNNTVLPESPLYRQSYATAATEFDPQQANRLLDGLGLSQRDGRGVRLMRDGRPLEIMIQTAGESTEQTDVLAIIHDSWLEVGIKLYSIPSSREVFRNRIFSGEAVMSIWSGVENALVNADTSPEEFIPSKQHQYQWPLWGKYYETQGRLGEQPSLAPVAQLVDLKQLWLNAENSAQRAEIWHRILGIHRDQIFSLGIVAGVLQPVVVNNALRNVPQQGIYNFSPGAYFGIYKPDTFWFEAERR